MGFRNYYISKVMVLRSTNPDNLSREAESVLCSERVVDVQYSTTTLADGKVEYSILILKE